MKIKIFWQPDCPYCPMAYNLRKELEKEYNVESYNTKTVDGLAEAAYNDVTSTPSIIIMDENEKEVKGWRGEVPKIEEVKNLIKEKND